jgi:hypothetical protein
MAPVRRLEELLGDDEADEAGDDDVKLCDEAAPPEEEYPEYTPFPGRDAIQTFPGLYQANPYGLYA